MSRKFQRTKEDFICENCGLSVHGSGYTNHCPACLWSKHVDVYPGDRSETCVGMMAPVEVDLRSGKYYLVHKCESCGIERRNKTAQEDDFETLMQIVESSTRGS